MALEGQPAGEHEVEGDHQGERGACHQGVCGAGDLPDSTARLGVKQLRYNQE